MYQKLHCLFLSILLALTAIPAAAQDVRPASLKKGEGNTDAGFGIGEIESVNHFTGALSLSLALAGPYPVAPDLEMQFQLSGHASSWEQESVACNPGGDVFINVPTADNNAGHAWRFSLGSIKQKDGKWIYTGLQGDTHNLHLRLHPGHPATTHANTRYTASSTYIRFRHFPTGSEQCSATQVSGLECALVQFPGEIEHEFQKVGSGDEDWRIVQMRSPLGGTVDIDYPAGGTSWVISDSTGRSHTVHFGGPVGEYRRITSFDLAAFGGTRRTINLQYTALTLARQDFNPATCPSEPTTVNVNALSRVVEQGDGSFYEMTYYTDDALSGDVLSGGISSLRLPGGGAMRWTYLRNVILSQDREHRLDAPFIITQGVATRELALSVDGAAIGTWTYDYAPSTVSIPGENHPCHRTTTVTDPLGNEQVFYHTTSLAHRWSFGLPFTRCGSGSYSNTGPLLSSEFYEGTVATGTLLRSVNVIYTSDGVAAGSGLDDQEKNNHRIYEETVFHDDGNRKRIRRFEDFALGQFRRIIEGVSWNADNGYETLTDFQPDAGTYIRDPDTGDTTGSTFVMPGIDDPWIPRNFTTSTVTTVGVTATQEHCFNSEGFELRRRILAGASRADNDLLIVLTPDADGRIATEQLYGGDDQALGDHVYDSLCDMTLPSTPRYEKAHTYQAGVRATTTKINPCDGSTLLSELDQTIDANTGLPSSSRTPSGVQSVLTYDFAGRPLTERPAAGAWTVWEYQRPSQAEPNRASQLTVRHCANGSANCTTGASLTWKRTDFDELGRAVTEHVRIPTTSGISANARHTTYNALGWTLTESSWINASHTTVFDQFDPFGRPGRITAPSQAPVEITFQGERVVTRKSEIALSAGLGDAYTSEIYNARGQLTRLCESQSTAIACDTGIETTYTYDVGGRVTRICLGRDGPNCGQIRRRLYDHRGYLTQIRDPEIGVNSTSAVEEPITITDPDGYTELDIVADAGNDWIFLTRDAVGNILTSSVQGSSEFDLTTTYDPAGRPVRVEGPNGVLKEMFYGTANEGTNKRAGNLVLAKRHHYLPGGEVITVSESFTYGGLDGRLSHKQTRASTPEGAYAFDLEVTYDPLGNVSTLNYPDCLHGGCSGTPNRTVSNLYTKGFLTSVPGYASTIDYQAGGIHHQVLHSNGITWTFEIDATTGIERPHRITTNAASALNTGIYSWDGTGNIDGIGSLVFTYDRLSRMLSGQVRLGSSTRTQSATYDLYGSVTALTTNGSVLSTPTDLTTNRLTGGTYDAAGNLTAYSYDQDSYSYRFDAMSVMTGLTNPDGARTFLYNAQDERIAELRCNGSECGFGDATRQTWTLRGPNDEVLRILTRTDGNWQWKQDYIYRGRWILATETPSGTFHHHPDHLGSPAQITDGLGIQADRHIFYPYGQESSNPDQNDFPLKFTGHERTITEPAATLDYMHARYCSAVLGRFLSPDPADSGKITSGQSWNRYPYAAGNPVRYVDPNGEFIESPWDFASVAASAALLARDIAKGDVKGSLISAAGLAVDITAAALPGIPGGVGIARQGAKAAAAAGGKALTAAQKSARSAAVQANFIKGQVFERSVLSRLGLTGSKLQFKVTGGKVGSRIVDGVARDGVTDEIKFLVEVKNVKEQSLTAQLRDFVEFAKTAGAKRSQVPLVLIVNLKTKLSGPLEELVKNGTIILIRTK